MNTKAAISLATLALVSADLPGLLSDAVGQASSLSSLVAGFSSAQGINSALQIQIIYNTASAAVVALESGVSAAPASDLNSNVLGGFANFFSVTTGLLDALTAKAADFAATGSTQIVSADIVGLSDPDEAIAKNVLSKISTDCAALSSVSSPLESLVAALNRALVAYSLPTKTSLTIPSCSGEASASHSSGAVETGASASGSSSAHASSAAPSKSSSATHPASVNGAVAIGAGAGLSLAAVAALLL